MFRKFFVVEAEFASSVRFPPLGQTEQSVQKLELAFLILMGITAATLVQFVELNLKIPGHAIIRVIFPIAFGIALVPRRGAGLTMGSVAAGAVLGFNVAHFGAAGVGAMTSLLLSGAVLDFVASRSRAGWPLYVGLALAGLTINMAAFGVKAASKLAGFGFAGGGKWHQWFPRAIVSYPLCGLAAGLICALILFRFRPREPQP